MPPIQRKSVLFGGEAGTFLTGVLGEDSLTIKKSNKLVRNLDRIGRLHTELNGVLSKYGDSLIGKVLKEEDNYMLAYKAEMMKVLQRLEDVRENGDAFKNALQREKYVVELEKSLNWFKEEAKRLANSTTEQSNEKQYWNEKIALFKQDIIILEQQMKGEGERLKELELATGNNSITHLSTALGKFHSRPTTQGISIVASQPRLKPGTTALKCRKACSFPKICHIIKYMLNEKIEKAKITEQVVSYYQDLSRKNTDVKSKLEAEIGKGSGMNTVIATQKIAERGSNRELLNIFVDSINTMKNVIQKRNSSYGRAIKQETNKKRSLSAINLKRRPVIFEPPKTEVKFRNFTATDKKGVFIEFLNHPQVFEKIRTLIDGELAKDKQKERKENIECTELTPPTKVTQFHNKTMTQLALESSDTKKRFQGSHLYPIPQGCPAFNRELSAPKIRKQHSVSLFQKSRPQTVSNKK